MKKSYSIVTLSLIAFFALFSFIPRSALADGMMMAPDPYSDRWDYSGENNQQAFINYDNGLQKMIISIGIDAKTSNGAVWLFPIPSAPDKIVIDVVENLPSLNGEEISGKVKSSLDSTAELLQMTQIYTIPFVSLFKTSSMTYGGLENSVGAPGGVNKNIESDVTVYEHLEKNGISSEIITAKTAGGIYDYLKNKGLNIEAGSIPVLDNYIGKEYSFVVSWIIPSETPASSQEGVFVTFPANDIYFPLLPTSVYGSKIVPATIRVIGHVSPKIYQDIKSYTKINYYTGGNADIGDGLENFYNGQPGNIKYTKIEINAPSKFLTADLWISNQTPVKTSYSALMAEHPLVVAIVIFLLASVITGIFAGFIVFKGLRKKPIKLCLIGLTNCLTILGVLAATTLVGTKNRGEDVAPLLAEIKKKGYFWKRKLAMILFFAAAPFLTLGVTALNGLVASMQYTPLSKQLIPLLIVYVLPIAALIIALFIKRIKSEDWILFGQLGAAGYSSWSFHPKDRMKIVFIPVFSASFLLISWLLVKLIFITV